MKFKYIAAGLVILGTVFYAGKHSHNNPQKEPSKLETKTSTEELLGKQQMPGFTRDITAYMNAMNVAVAKERDQERGINPESPDSNTRKAVTAYKNFQEGKHTDPLNAAGPYRIIGDTLNAIAE